MVTDKLQVMRMCDHVLVMHNGGIAESGTYDEVDGAERSLRVSCGGWGVGE
jgi:ABC-type methionine transport system ATPase subunit